MKWDNDTKTTPELRKSIKQRLRWLGSKSEPIDDIHCDRTFPVNLSEAQNTFWGHFRKGKISSNEFTQLNFETSQLSVDFSENCNNKILR